MRGARYCAGLAGADFVETGIVVVCCVVFAAVPGATEGMLGSALFFAAWLAAPGTRYCAGLLGCAVA